ncbi:MAG: PhnD/SsuA/transferrin family substrate-binding protein, partial [Duodenibacillus sp.]|nr:PhnD/SsuA/transferrin family substrate-binding protein [Duodenibacillus sp.]
LRRAARLAFVCFAGLAAAPFARADVVLGVMDFEAQKPSYPILAPTVEAIRAAFPGEAVRVRLLGIDAMSAALQTAAVDAFVCSSGLYRRNVSAALTVIASAVGPHMTDPNRGEGTAFVALASRGDIDGVASMRGLRAVASNPGAFSGHYIALRELQLAGYDPERFFGSLAFERGGQASILARLERGEADVAILHACTLEAFARGRDPDVMRRFKVIGAKSHPGFRCLHSSTELYPGWVLGVTGRASSEKAARIYAAAFAMPKTPEGLFWGIATDFSKIDELNRALEIGPYAFLKDYPLQALWEKYGLAAQAAAALLALLALHSWRSGALVRRARRELTALWRKEREARQEAARMRERLAALQRALAVSQISSLVAHELGQPLGAIVLWAGAMDEALAQPAPDAGRLSAAAQAVRAQALKA